MTPEIWDVEIDWPNIVVASVSIATTPHIANPLQRRLVSFIMCPHVYLFGYSTLVRPCNKGIHNFRQGYPETLRILATPLSQVNDITVAIPFTRLVTFAAC